MDETKEKPKTWTESFVSYSISNKGRQLTLSVSMMYVLILMVISLALIIGEILGAGPTRRSGQVFFIGLFAVSIVSMTVLLVFGTLQWLTVDNHYRDQRSTTFVRAGMIGLGTGGIVYFVVGVAEFLDLNESCNDFFNLVYEFGGIIFILVQMALLVKYSRLRINKCVPMILAARFMTAQIVATNGCLWIYLVALEAKMEVEHSQTADKKNSTVHTTAAPFANHENNTVLPHKEECESYHRLEELLGPYAFPMLIEYCVLSATMILVIWENSGIGYEPKGTTANSSSDSDEATAPVDEGIVMRSRPSLASLYKRHSVATLGSTADLSSLFSQSYHVKPTQHYNSFSGFVFGWIIICATSGTVILSLYRLYTDFEDNKTDGGFEDPNVHNVTYGSNAILSILCIIAAPITFFKLSKLTFEDEEALETVLNEKGKDDVEYASDVKERIDNQLGVITLLCLISWKIFCIIAAFDQDDAVLLADGVISIIFGMIQSLFLTYAQKKRTKTRSQLLRKPGYQGLEFLRLTNFALWLNNTFLLKHPYAKSMMNATYGEMEWAVLSNIFQPLSILYYFHAMISVTETVHHVYSSKFVGIVRQSKQRMATMTQINEEQEDFD